MKIHYLNYTMSLADSYNHFEEAKTEALGWLEKELVGLRTGRVRTTTVAPIVVEHYGTRTPLQGLGSITATDARTLVISPWDASALPAIKKALTEAQLGAQPVEDGKLIRLSFPALTSEMRQQTVRLLHKKAEEARVQLRQGRDAALSMLKKMKQASTITEDDFYEGKEKLDSLIDEANREIGDSIKTKEKDITTV